MSDDDSTVLSDEHHGDSILSLLFMIFFIVMCISILGFLSCLDGLGPDSRIVWCLGAISALLAAVYVPIYTVFVLWFCYTVLFYKHRFNCLYADDSLCYRL